MRVSVFLLLSALYSCFVSDTVVTRIKDAQVARVGGIFMIPTDYRPFINQDAKYRLKFDSGTLQQEAIRLKGKEVQI